MKLNKTRKLKKLRNVVRKVSRNIDREEIVEWIERNNIGIDGIFSWDRLEGGLTRISSNHTKEISNRYTSTFQGSVNVLFKEGIKKLPTPAYFSANISATFSAEFMDSFLGSVLRI